MSGNQSALTIECATEVATAQLGETMALALRPGDLVLLRGDLGAGKTSLARSLIRSAAGDENLEVPSPTFTLAQVYAGLPFGQLMHMDLYRLESPDELVELGLDDALADGAVLVEWPDKGDLQDDQAALVLQISVADDDARTISIIGQPKPMARLRRSRVIRDYLDHHNLAQSTRLHLTGDASTRAYETIIPTDDTDPVILMNAPAQPDGPPIRDGKPYSQIARLAEDMRAFEGVDLLLERAGFRVPHILNADHEQGLLLIESLGSGTIIDAARAPIADRYAASVATLAAVHQTEWQYDVQLADGSTYTVPPYDAEAMKIEIDLLPSWYAEHAKGTPLTTDELSSFWSIWEGLIDRAQGAASSLVLRDYHSPNIIWRDGAKGHARIGIIDFQDATIGPQAYDVASLVHDARVDISRELEADLTDHYYSLRQQDSEFDEAAFRETLAIMQAQRATKLHGIFVRLSKRDGKDAYLAHLPRIEDYLARACEHPVLAELDQWVKTVLRR